MPITQSIVLAAGFGTRLRPITDTVPKAMVRVNDKPLLDYALDHLQNAGVTDAIVNTHYLPDVITHHLKHRTHPKIVFSHEPEILETGGGIQNVLPQFGNHEFFAINADSLWRDHKGQMPLLSQLVQKWDGAKMDALLALIPHPSPFVGCQDMQGDFGMESDGTLRRKGLPKPLPANFIGVQILHPRLFADAPGGKFSLNILYDRAEAAGRLYGHMARTIDWFHISNPADLAETQAIFRSRP